MPESEGRRRRSRGGRRPRLGWHPKRVVGVSPSYSVKRRKSVQFANNEAETLFYRHLSSDAKLIIFIQMRKFNLEYSFL